MSSESSALPQFLNLGDETVRVYSDGVPERDFRKEPARGSCADKHNYKTLTNKGHSRRPDA